MIDTRVCNEWALKDVIVGWIIPTVKAKDSGITTEGLLNSADV